MQERNSVADKAVVHTNELIQVSELDGTDSIHSQHHE